MSYVSSDERLLQLAKELHAILNDCVAGCSVATEEQVKEVRELKREIAMMGVLVEWKYVLIPESGQVDTIVTLYKVKENLSPEYQKIYDDWFMEINGLKI